MTIITYITLQNRFLYYLEYNIELMVTKYEFQV